VCVWQVLGIGKDVPAASYAAASVVAAIIGSYSTAQVLNGPGSHQHRRGAVKPSIISERGEGL
jgi:hypothetical protein